MAGVYVCKSKRVTNMQDYTSIFVWSFGMFINWGKNVFSQPSSSSCLFSEQPHKIFKQKITQLPLGHGYTQYKVLLTKNIKYSKLTQ